jgi:predicted nucleic acid-binding protein
VPIASDAAYLDASALVKMVIEEAETEALRAALRAWRRHVSSRIVIVEVVRGVTRRDPEKVELARRVLERLVVLGLRGPVLVSAARLEPPTLRAIDAIHVASAARLGRSLAAFVSYDALQLEAARALGLPTASPR